MPTMDEQRSHTALQEIPRQLKRLADVQDRAQKVAELDLLTREYEATQGRSLSPAQRLRRDRLDDLTRELWPDV